MALDGLMIALLIVAVIVLIAIAYKLYSKGGSTNGSSIILSHGDIISKLKESDKRYEDVEKKRQEYEKNKGEEMKEIIKEVRDHQMKVVNILSGTKSSGNIGEHMIKEYLADVIKARKVITPLRVENSGEVEFAWKITDSKFIPIDSKFPQVIDLYEEYQNTDNQNDKKKIKKDISDKLKLRISEAKKYGNKKNTLQFVIVAIPDELVALLPEIISSAYSLGIFVVGYSNIMYICLILEEMYKRLSEEGDIEEYHEILISYRSIIGDILKKTETIDKGISMVKKANDNIKDNAREAITTKVKKKRLQKEEDELEEESIQTTLHGRR